MPKPQNLFFSCVESRLEDQGSLYARFHLGTFFRGQALTFANALRRTLLSEIPGFIITDLIIDGANHEFATLPGVEETVLDILLNLKKLVFAPTSFLKITGNDLQNFKVNCFLQSSGPGQVTAADLKLPLGVKCINLNAHIANLTTSGELNLRFELQIRNPQNSRLTPNSFLSENKRSNIVLDTIPMPVQKVNYIIKELNSKQGSEYTVLEVWTDGSFLPQDTVQYALRNLTHFFFQFANIGKS